VTDPLGPEGLLGIDPDRVAVHPAVVLRAGDVHCELMPNLRLSTTELAVHLPDRLRLEAAPEELVQSFRAGRELGDGLPALEDHDSGLEATDVDGLTGRDDDFLGHVRADL